LPKGLTDFVGQISKVNPDVTQPSRRLPGDCSETGMSGGLDLSNDPAGRWPHTAPPAPH
jgi:hypothetical protein